VRIRVKLYTKDRPKADQSPSPVMIEVPDGTREFEHEGKRYKIVGQQGSVHQGDISGSLETDAVEM
jgi:hypothetical protein